MRTQEHEIDMLRRWYDEARQEPDSYLAGFMSPSMAVAIEKRISDGRDTNIHADMESLRKQLLARPSPAEVDALRQQLKDAIEQCNKLETIRGELNGKISFEMQENVRLNRELQNERRRGEILHADRDRCLKRIQGLQDEINRLAARLWYTHEAMEQVEVRDD